MSHEVKYYDYPEKINRKSVQETLDRYVAMEDYQEGCTGLSSPIRWLESISPCSSYEEAQDRIKANDKGWYDSLAVRYKITRAVMPTKGMTNAADAVNKAQKAYNELKDKLNADFFGCTSEYVGCKECGSKLKRSLLKKPNCPLCGRNLLSDTATTRLMNAKERIVNLQKRQKDEVLKEQKKAVKADKNAEVRWLVKIEYHT